jgi:4'-phosphopantetheinyl transferase
LRVAPPLEIIIWSLTNPPLARAELAATLSNDERARAGRFMSAAHGDEYIAAHGMMRHLLAERLACVPPSLSFVFGPHGKPRLAEAGHIEFNLSHSGGYAALGIARGAAVGIDIEEMRPITENIAARFFSPAEVRALDALPTSDRARGFFHCWTRKEAVIKMTGQGLARRLDSFDVSLGPDIAPVLLRFDDLPAPADHISLVHFDVTPAIVGAAATSPATNTPPSIQIMT